mgnify:CR=1 FL=1
MDTYKIWIVAVAGTLLLLAGAIPGSADMTESVPIERIGTDASVSAGYRGVGSDDNPNRAREYDSLESSPFFKFNYFTDKGGYHLDLGIDYLNEDDYAAEAHLDTNGLLRIDLRSTRFYHNLDHIPYDNGFTGVPYRSGTAPTPSDPFIPVTLIRDQVKPPVKGSRPDAVYPAAPNTTTTSSSYGVANPYRAYYSDQNPGDEYGLRLDVNEAKIKIKCPSYPAHLTLSYWRYEKEGEKQLRFVSHGERNGSADCTGCHMQSKTRDIDRITEEIKMGVDAHVGIVDVVLEGLLRTFRDREPIPQDTFRFPVDGTYPHDENPDSRLKELTLRLNTAPSGGLVGSTSFTVGQRENLSDLKVDGPIKAETDFYKASADVTYTPSENWTMSMRYRLLDLDSDNTDYYTTYGNTTRDDFDHATVTTADDPLAVREAMDITRAWYEALVNYRPWRYLTLKAELRREDIERSNTGKYPETGAWNLPDQETVSRLKLGFQSRFLEKSALKVSGWLALQRSDEPAYGTTAEEGRELYLSTTYSADGSWGITANANLLSEDSNDRSVSQLDTRPSTDPAKLVSYDNLDRSKDQQNFSLGSWVNLREGLSLDVNYGYMRTAISQDLLFGTQPDVDGVTPSEDYTTRDDGVDYRQTVQTVSVGVNWLPADSVSCRLEGYHIRSKANFSPEFFRSGFAYSGTSELGVISSADLRDISELDIRQNGLRGRVNWQIDEHWSCGVEATYDKYDEAGSDVYDGAVQTCMVSFSRSW